MRNLLFIFLIIIPLVASEAQKPKTWLAIETDPITTLFGATTLSVLIEPQRVGNWSLSTNIVAADFPDWMDNLLNPANKGKGFDTRIAIGGGFAIDYFLKAEREGCYVGFINLFFQNKVEKGGASGDVLSHNIIPRVGYRWYPFERSNFYVNPFLGIRYEYLPKHRLIVGGEEFEAAGFGPFGTIHIGYHF